MRTRKYLIGILVLLVLFVMAVIINGFLHRPKQINLYKATPGGTNIQFPYLAGPNSIEFFTGSGFAAYDTKTQTSQNISPQFTFPTVSQVRWSKTGVLLKASDYTVADDLYPAITKKALSVSGEYWWLYDFASQKLSMVLPNIQYNVVDAFWNSSGTNYCYISTDGSLHVSGTTDIVVAKVDQGARIKQFGDNVITLTQGNTLEQISTTGHHSIKTLVTGAFQDSYVSPDGKTIAYVINTHPKSSGVVPGDLYKIGPSDGKPHKVLSGFDGVLAGSGGDLYAGYSDTTGNRLQLYPKTGRTVNYSLGVSLNKGDLIGTVLPVSPDTIYVVSKNNNLAEVTDRNKTVSVPISYKYRIQTDLYKNGFEIHYDPYKDTYEVDITTNPYLVNQQAALDYIRTQAVDPNQIRIFWRAYDGVDTTNPHVDTTPVPAGTFGV